MRKKFLISGITALFLVAGFIFFSLSGWRDDVVSATCIVEGTEVALASKVSGRIAELRCKEWDRVNEGAVLIRLESDEIEASVERARSEALKLQADIKAYEASIETAHADIKSAEAEIKSSKAETEGVRARMEKTLSEMQKAERLYKDGSASKADMNRAIKAYLDSRAANDALKARFKAAILKKNAALSQLNSSGRLLPSAKERLTEAEAELKTQEARLGDMEIRAPISGTVVFKAAKAGEAVTPGATILSVVNLEDLWLRTNLEETFIGYIRSGEKALIKTGWLPWKTLRGTVGGVEKAGLAAQKNIKQGIRIMIKVTDKTDTLKPGMTVKLEVPKTG